MAPQVACKHREEGSTAYKVRETVKAKERKLLSIERVLRKEKLIVTCN